MEVRTMINVPGNLGVHFLSAYNNRTENKPMDAVNMSRFAKLVVILVNRTIIFPFSISIPNKGPN